MDSVDKAGRPEILDFYDERNKDNPLVYKNPQLRAEVDAMNEAIRKALPSLKDFDSSDEPCVMLSREVMVADFYRNKPPFLERKPSDKVLTEDDVKFFTPPDDLDEVLDAKLGTDFVLQKKRKQEAERKSALVNGVGPKAEHVDANIKNEDGRVLNLGPYAENTAARGDGFETADQPEVKTITIDLRPPKSSPEIIKSSNKSEEEADKAANAKTAVHSPADNTEKGAMEKSTTSIHSKEAFAGKDETSDDDNSTSASPKDSLVPRACLQDTDDGAQVQCKDLNPHLLREVFEIRAGQAADPRSPRRGLSSLSESSSGEFDRACITKDVAENVADCFELNNRISDAWDWVTAIPRAYYMEEGNLLECFRKRACRLDDTLDFRILRETFRSSSFYSNTKACSREPHAPAAYGREPKASADDAPPLLSSLATKSRQKENWRVSEPSSILNPSKAKEKIASVKKRVEPLNEIDPNVCRPRDPKLYRPDSPNGF